MTINPTVGPNTYTGATIVNGGTLSLARAGANSGTAITGGTLAQTAITVNAPGTLLLSANYTLTTTSTVTLSGGAFSFADTVLQGQGAAVAGGVATGTNIVGIGTLTLTANSTLNFLGNSGTAVFNSFDPTNIGAGNFSLSITGTNFGTAMTSADGTNNRLIFDQFLSPAQLSDITFMVSGSAFSATETSLGGNFYEIIPGGLQIPEPGTYAMIAAGVGMLLGLQRLRRKA